MYFLPDSQDPELKNSIGTSKFCLFMDKLFDSLNASSFLPQPGKSLKSAIKSDSNHFQFWNEAIKVFESLKFVDQNDLNKVLKSPPTVKNWISTLHSIKYLWLKL